MVLCLIRIDAVFVEIEMELEEMQFVCNLVSSAVLDQFCRQ
jgi:hypothetical protein